MSAPPIINRMGDVRWEMRDVILTSSIAHLPSPISHLFTLRFRCLSHPKSPLSQDFGDFALGKNVVSNGYLRLRGRLLRGRRTVAKRRI